MHSSETQQGGELLKCVAWPFKWASGHTNWVRFVGRLDLIEHAKIKASMQCGMNVKDWSVKCCVHGGFYSVSSKTGRWWSTKNEQQVAVCHATSHGSHHLWSPTTQKQIFGDKSPQKAALSISISALFFDAYKGSKNALAIILSFTGGKLILQQSDSVKPHETDL